MKKRYLLLMLVALLLMTIVFTACTNDEDSEYVGLWLSDTYEFDGETYPAKDIGYSYFDITADKRKVHAVLTGDEYELKWVYKSNGIVIYENTEEDGVVVILKDGNLIFEDEDEGGKIKIIFKQIKPEELPTDLGWD